MKKLTKVLSLVLVIAMIVSLCVVGVSAKTFTDSDKVTANYKEAVDLVSDLGIVTGTSATSSVFNAAGNFTRAEACVMLAKATLGASAANIAPNTVTFKDVPTSFWGYKYIEYCANAGLVAGVGDGKFAPTATLTGIQFAKMLMDAAGVDTSSIKGGANWAIDTAKLYFKTGFSSVAATNAVITREAAAQMTYDALFYAADATEGYPVYVTEGGVKTLVGVYGSMTDAATAAKAFNDVATVGKTYSFGTEKTPVDGKTTLAKTVFGVTRDNDGDAFGRPGTKYTVKMSTVPATAAAVKAYGWTSANKFVADVAVVTYTAATKAAQILSDLTGYYTSTGVAVKATDAATYAALTANGKALEFYANADGVLSNVAIEYTVGTISTVTTTKTQTSYVIKNAVADVTGIDYVDPATADTISFTGTLAKGDVVTYAVKNGVAYVYATTNVTGTQSTKNTANSTITVSGKDYTVGTGVLTGNSTDKVALADFSNSAVAAVYYIDQFGFVVKTTATAASNNYAYIVNALGKVDTTLLGTTPSAQVLAVLQDGTVGTYVLNLTKTAEGNYTAGGVTVFKADEDADTVGNQPSTTEQVSTYLKGMTGDVFGYVVSDKTITLQPLTATSATQATAAADIKGGQTLTNTNVLMTAATQYVIYNATKNTAVAYTGNTAVPATTTMTAANTQVVYVNNGTANVAKIVFSTAATDTAATVKNYIFIDSTAFVQGMDSTGAATYTYTGVAADSTPVTVMATAANKLNNTGLYTYNTDNSITNANAAYTNDGTNWVDATSGVVVNGTATVAGSLIAVGGNYYNLTADTKTVMIDSTKTEVNGNSVLVVRAVTATGTATSNAAVIYVIG